MLLHIERVLTHPELQDIRTLLARGEFADGRVTAGFQSATVKHNLQLPEHTPLAAELGNRVLAALERCPRFTSAALPRHLYPPLFNCYSTGMSFGNHVDNAIRHADRPLRTDLSLTLFLSEPDEYAGGELVVTDTYGTHHVKLPAGDLLLYPSGSLHQVTPVTRGARLACFFWLQSMVRDNGQRQLLYELDQAIIALREQLPDGLENSELLKLANCYHNLLRQWAEV